VAPDGAIGLQRADPNQRCQLAGRTPPRQVHLEEAILRVHEPGGACDIAAGCALNRGDTERVADDRDRTVEPGELKRAVKLRQARTQLPPEPEPRPSRSAAATAGSR
jgi:hypothetical protein